MVAERAIGVDGPIREYYPDGFDAADPHRTEICWPVFRTALTGRVGMARRPGRQGSVASTPVRRL